MPDSKAAAAATTEAPSEVTLVEFCTRLSKTDKRVEMIAGFESTERRAGRIKGDEAGYAARYVAFTTQPA